jgi:prepilin-type processing-associated H-X9-DG protein
MTPNYEDAPTGPSKKPGMPVWGWVLIGCLGVPLLLVLILAAILFPVFAQARDKARQVSCLSNCKQMGLAAMMYMQDYDETLPPKNAKWTELYTPYIKNPDVYRCPAVRSAPYGYAMNPEPLGQKLEKIKDPAAIKLLYDSDVTGPDTLAAPEAIAYRHGGSEKIGNVAYLDGHAKSVKQGSDD